MEARDPNSKEERNEWNPKGSLGSKLKRREKRVESQGKVGIQTQKKRETSGIPREARDPNSKEEENQVESQRRLGIQTQKKKRIEWNLKGGLGS